MANVMAGLVEPDHVEAGAERTSWFSVTMPCSSFMGGEACQGVSVQAVVRLVAGTARHR